MQARSHPPDNTDPLLHPFLQAADETEAQRLLAELIAEHAQPVVREIARSKLYTSRSTPASPAEETDDVCAEVMLQLLSRLRDLRSCTGPESIANFRGYVAAVTFNSCTQVLRRKYPERQRLKNRLRYVLNHDSRFALWEDPQGNSLCGLANWKGGNYPAAHLQPSAGDSTFEQSLYDTPNLRQLPARALLDVLFSLSAQPIAVEELVGVVAKIWGVEDLRAVENKSDEDGDEVWSRFPDSRVNVAVQVERRMYLTALWQEICELRPLQRGALLLNLHDANGQDMLPMFIHVEVVHLPDIAASLDMPAHEFAELWNRLPLDDATIAQRMGLTRQQVINLRKSARERLARRMAKRW